MCAEVKAWHKAQCEIILAEMRPPPASSTTTTAANLPPNDKLNRDASGNPPEAPNDAAPTGEDKVEVEEVFEHWILGVVIICTLIAAMFCGEYATSRRE
jgi:hypothetical protein